ncbi:regulator [Thermoplasma sp.]|uniref:regulator n=1 Tax=Thermoplasma sp. TaxID=1973142 RepID=UPI002621B7B7|nr:regulator [Thermoplasma sp.]
MLLILDEYFKEHPIKLRIIDGLYRSGISIRDGRFFTNDVEISVSEIANAFDVNRKTVYETIKLVESSEPLKKVMSSIKPMADIADVALLTGNQIITAYTSLGHFPYVFREIFSAISKYGCYIREIFSRNISQEESFIRIIFYRPIPDKIIGQIRKIDGVKSLEVRVSTDVDQILCNNCDIKICPTKFISDVEKEEIGDL